MSTSPRPALHPDTLYLGDNGRAFCGSLTCAGQSAYFTGRGISGQKVMRLSAQEAISHGIKCEHCGKVAQLVTIG